MDGVAVDGDNEYLIVTDVAETLAYRYGMKEAMNDPKLHERIKDLERELCVRLQSLVEDGIRVRRIDATELSDKILIECRKLAFDSVIICLDRSYFPDALHFDLTTQYGGRVVNHSNFQPIDQQIVEIKAALDRMDLLRTQEKHSVILVDVGISDGLTIARALMHLKEGGIAVNAIVSGITSKRGKSRLEERDCKIVTIDQGRWHTWDDARDLFMIDGTQAPPQFMKDDIRRFIPFIETVDTKAVSDIRADKHEEMKSLCTEMNRRLLNLLKENSIDTKAIGEFITVSQVKTNKSKSS